MCPLFIHKLLLQSGARGNSSPAITYTISLGLSLLVYRNALKMLISYSHRCYRFSDLETRRAREVRSDPGRAALWGMGEGVRGGEVTSQITSRLLANSFIGNHPYRWFLSIFISF